METTMTTTTVTDAENATPVSIMYVCMKCGKDVELDRQLKRVRCPFCGYKILIKKRSGTIKKMKAR